MLCSFKVSFLIEDLTVELHVRMCVYVLRMYVFMYECPSVRPNNLSVRFKNVGLYTQIRSIIMNGYGLVWIMD